MTVTVEAGIRIDRLAHVLKSEGQRLPIDIAQADRAQSGGAIATKTSGPRRFGLGTFRDYVIGLTAMTAEGRVFHSGGRVVKNVAGYDLCKLLVGSLGTLAVITQVTLKLKPVPETSVLAWAAFEKMADREAAVEGLLTSETRPVAIETLNPSAARLIQSQCSSPLRRRDRRSSWDLRALVRSRLANRNAPPGIERVPSGRLHRRCATRMPTGCGSACRFSPRRKDRAHDPAHLLPSKAAAFEEQATRLGLATVCHAGDGILIGRFADQAKAEDVSGRLARLADWARQNHGSLVLVNSEANLPATGSALEGNSRATSLMRELKVAFDPAACSTRGNRSLPCRV